MIESFEWFIILLEFVQKISGILLLFSKLEVGKVDENKFLMELFGKDVKVCDLFEEFGWFLLEVIGDDIKNE